MDVVSLFKSGLCVVEMQTVSKEISHLLGRMGLLKNVLASWLLRVGLSHGTIMAPLPPANMIPDSANK